MDYLLVTGIFPPDVGGPATYIPKLAKYLSKQEIRVVVVTLHSKDDFENPDKHKIVSVSRALPFPIRFMLTAWKIHSQISSETRVFANGLHEESAIAIRIKKNCHAVAKIVGDPVWERARNAGRTNSDIVTFQNEKPSPRAYIQRKFLVWALNNFEEITCPSQELCKFVSDWGVKSRITYIPNGVSIETSDKNAVRDLPMITASRLVPWKNLELVIQLAKACNTQLTILGDGPLREELENFAQRIGANVNFLGNQSQELMKTFFQRAKLFVLLSDYEGMSFALLQAMASGCVPVVSRIPGNMELVTNGVEGFTGRTQDIQDLIPKVTLVLKDDELFTKMSSSAVTKVNESFEEVNQMEKVRNLMLGAFSGS